jgi:oxygen-dependent protoporphyrinogen oxidase
MPAQIPLPVVVIGGGISGLACAWRLQQSGVPVLLLDAANRAGGVISTYSQENRNESGGFVFERGPQSFLSSPPLLDLIASLGLQNELLHADPKAPRFILLHGKLVPAPLSPASLLTTPLFGPMTKWRLLTEILHRTQPPAGDESIAAFVRRKFGDEMLQRLVAPFVSGVYAGDPEQLSLRAAFPKLHEFENSYGSVLRGAMRSRPPKGTPRPGLCSFRKGVETLPRTLGIRLGPAYRPATVVTAVRPPQTNGKAALEVTAMRGDQNETIPAAAVIVATPTNAAAELLANISDRIAELLLRIKYAPVAVVSAGYRLEHIRESTEGFGFLVPRTEGLRTLGTVWNSSLFPGRAPEGMACFTSFAGGATDPGLCEKTDAEIASIVCGEVARALRIEGEPVITSVHRYARAIPQFNLGHTDTISAINGIISGIPGLFLAGNYLTGPSIGSCVEQANQVADSVIKYCASAAAAYCTA